jgi:hypothetical protein
MNIPAAMLITPDAKYGPCGLRKYVKLRIMRYRPTMIMMIPKMLNAVCAAVTT